MAKLQIKYRLEGKALPPRPIRVAIGGWGGSAERKKENGSEPEPWHCPAFIDGCTHGFELLYQYETECHVLNVNGKVSFQWSREGEPGGGADPRNDFTLSNPPPPTEYLFGTSLDIQAPPGYALRTEPHPRLFRDETQTVPAAFYGHVSSEWWPKKLFVVFKLPAPGQRHIFRKGEPYAQILFIPRNDEYVLSPMTPEEQAGRRKLEADIKLTKSLIAKRIWNSASGMEFNDHYVVLSRIYDREGLEGVEAAVREGVERYHQVVPEGKSVAEYLDLAKQAFDRKEFVEAKEILHLVLKLDSRSAEAHRQMAMLNWEQNVPRGAVIAMRQAVALQPNDPQYRATLAEMFRRVGRLDFAQQELEAALNLQPNEPEVLSKLGLTMAQRGMTAEGMQRCRTAASIDPRLPSPRYVMGLIYANTGRRDEARTEFEAALALDPNFTAAREALDRLSAPTPHTPTPS